MVFERDNLNSVVCNIRIPDGKNEKIGTGVFISKGSDCYLLTASHVVTNINVNTYAVLSDNSQNPIRVDLSILLGGAAFVKHPIADLAYAKISLTTTNQDYMQNRCFPYDHIELSCTPISKDIELTSIGFPLGLGAVGPKFSPLSFRTFVSSPQITLPRFDNQVNCDFIILELPSIGGYSGGPLFDLGYIKSAAIEMTKEKTILYGIVHGTLSDVTGGKLAAITPLKYLNGWM